MVAGHARSRGLIVVTANTDELKRVPGNSVSRTGRRPTCLEESDRAARVARACALAERTFANRDKADRWLHKSLNSLGGRTPMELIRTDAGARIVENLMARISWGAPA